MRIFRKKADLRDYLQQQRQKNARIGFVPTMGALHQGHLSLIESSKKDNSITVCSIFVNPTQFNDPRDFEKYPITLDTDIQALVTAGCDLLFLPSVPEVYPDGFAENEHYELGYLETILEGQYRPGHFQGVCKVVRRLLDIVEPDNLYLGQKDYQQCMVITELIRLMKKQDNIAVHICPTLREPDGLAMSSRNIRLNADERKRATVIYQILLYIKDHLQKGDLTQLELTAFQNLRDQGFKPDYIEIADADTLELINEWDGKRPLVAVVAAFLNQVRLIDNMKL